MIELERAFWKCQKSAQSDRVLKRTDRKRRQMIELEEAFKKYQKSAQSDAVLKLINLKRLQVTEHARAEMPEIGSIRHCTETQQSFNIYKNFQWSWAQRSHTGMVIWLKDKKKCIKLYCNNTTLIKNTISSSQIQNAPFIAKVQQ